MSRTANERYQRQISLKEFGESGQRKLQDARVLVIGAGGLGCPALLYLAGAGVGKIGIADFDLVTLSNLHRQVIYSVSDIGLSKALRAGEILRQLNPEIEIEVFNERLSTANSLEILSSFDIILDGTDNFASRYMINDACVLLNKILVYGAISRYEGQLAIFNCSAGNTGIPVSYRDLFPQAPAEGEVMNCEEAGVIGVLPGIIGTMMANETIKLITGLGEPLVNRLLTYNSLNNTIYELELIPGPETLTLIPANADEFIAFNYDWFCSTQAASELEQEIFARMLGDSNLTVIDVREAGETPFISEFEHIQIPLSCIRENIRLIQGETILLFCQSGKRSSAAVRILSDYYGNSKKIFSLKGGISAWKN